MTSPSGGGQQELPHFGRECRVRCGELGDGCEGHGVIVPFRGTLSIRPRSRAAKAGPVRRANERAIPDMDRRTGQRLVSRRPALRRGVGRALTGPQGPRLAMRGPGDVPGPSRASGAIPGGSRLSVYPPQRARAAWTLSALSTAGPSTGPYFSTYACSCDLRHFLMTDSLHDGASATPTFLYTGERQEIES